MSGYVQDDFRLNDRVTTNLGVRVRSIRSVDRRTHASPRLNVALQVGGGAVVHASYNHFFVPPPIEGVLSSAAGLTRRISDIGVALPPVQPTTENQLGLGALSPAGPLRVAGLTGYYRASNNPVGTRRCGPMRASIVARVFDRARAYGLEAKAEIPRLARYGLTGYFNYALGRVYFLQPGDRRIRDGSRAH